MITPLDPLTPPPAIHAPLSPDSSASTSELSWSSSSSSSGPRTPPPVTGPILPIPSSTHWALSFDSQLSYNAALPLQLNSFISSHSYGPLHHSPTSPTFAHDCDFLAEPATYPPLPSLTLTCEDIPWVIEARPSLPNLFVTVYDALQAINSSLRARVLDSERSLFASQQTQDEIFQTFQARVAAIPDVYQREEQRAKSVRRIDCLMGRTRLLGAYCDKVERPDVLMLSWGWPQ